MMIHGDCYGLRADYGSWLPRFPLRLARRIVITVGISYQN